MVRCCDISAAGSLPVSPRKLLQSPNSTEKQEEQEKQLKEMRMGSLCFGDEEVSLAK